MNTNKEKTSQDSRPAKRRKAKHPIHPYFTSNSTEETIKRMRNIGARIAKFEEQLNASRKSDKG